MIGHRRKRKELILSGDWLKECREMILDGDWLKKKGKRGRWFLTAIG